MRRIGLGIGACLAAMGVIAGGTAEAGFVNFGGQTWEEIRTTGTNVTTSGGDVQVEFTGDGEYWLHLNRAIPDINVNGTPFVSFSFIVNAIAAGDRLLVDLFIDDESGVSSSDPTHVNPRHQATFEVNDSLMLGSPLQNAFGAEKYTDTGAVSNPQQDTDGSSVTGGLGVERTVSIAKLADGTVEYNLDGQLWQSSFLKNSYGDTDFEFGDIYLRVRDYGGANGVSAGANVTFTNFEATAGAGASPVPEPASMALMALGGVGLLGYRRRKLATA